jgi:hypothetical protein
VGRSSTADVDQRASLDVRLCFAHYLVRDRGGIALSEKQVLEQVHDGVALRPAEVAMRRLAGRVTQVQEEGGDGVGDDRALGAEYPVAADL